MTYHFFSYLILSHGEINSSLNFKGFFRHLQERQIDFVEICGFIFENLFFFFKDYYYYYYFFFADYYIYIFLK